MKGCGATISLVYPTSKTMSIEDASSQVYPGWEKLIRKMFEQLFDIGWDGRVLQIKEKFGLLRVYLSAPKYIPIGSEEIVKRAVDESSTTCCECGRPGELDVVYRKVLCSEHTIAEED